MDSDVYWACVVLAGEWAAGYLPRPYALTRDDPLPRTRRAIYIVTDYRSEVLYVGKTVRGAKSRRLEHVRDRAKALGWAAMWIVPLRDDTPLSAVLAAEGTIGDRLRPRHNRRLPRARTWALRSTAGSVSIDNRAEAVAPSAVAE